MHELKSPPEKIQALFFQALRVADPKLKPSDIEVTVQPLRQSPSNTPSVNLSDEVCTVTIDFSKTSFAKHVGGMSHGLINIGGAWSARDGKILFRGFPNNFDNVKVKDVQRALALSLSLPLYRESNHLAEALGAAAMGRGQSVA